MEKTKQYLKLIRIKHYLKNILIFIPLLFSGKFIEKNILFITLLGFISFSFLASMVYIINDLKDIENDREHQEKKYRPLASGSVSTNEAKFILMVLLLMVILIDTIMYRFGNINLNYFILSILIELLYLVLNLFYSFGLKNIPIVDVTILVLGFVLRMLYGAQIGNIIISNWLYLTVMSGSFYMAFGKRRNEIKKQGEISREVLKRYSQDFLDKFMYVYLILTIVFYSLWCIDAQTIQRVGNSYMIFTIPLLLIILMKYSLNVENDSYGDPVDVIWGDKVLMSLIAIFGLIMIFLLYIV